MNRLFKSARSGPPDHNSVFAEFAACLMCLLAKLRRPAADKTHRASRAPRFRVVR